MGGWEDIALGALAGGSSAYINSKIDDYEKQEAQIRKESELRLRQQLNQENLNQRHRFAIDEADYRNRLINERADRTWNRSNSGAVDELGMPITREELTKIRESGGKYTSGALWNVQHRKQPVLKEQQLHDWYIKVYGPERGNELFLATQFKNKSTNAQTLADLAPKDRAKILSEGMKAYNSLSMPPTIKGPDGKEVEMPPEQWLNEVYYPMIFQQKQVSDGAFTGPKEKQVVNVNDKVLVDATKRLSALPPDEQYVALQKISQKLGKPSAEKVAIMLSYTNDRNKNKKFVKAESKNVDPLVDYYEGLPPGQPGRSGLKYYQDNPLRGALSGLFKPVSGPTGMAARGRR